LRPNGSSASRSRKILRHTAQTAPPLDSLIVRQAKGGPAPCFRSPGLLPPIFHFQVLIQRELIPFLRCMAKTCFHFPL
jgi:hypothetical protein